MYVWVWCVASNQAPPPPHVQLIKRAQKSREGESLEDFNHVLDIDDVFWTWFSISGQGRPRISQHMQLS